MENNMEVSQKTKNTATIWPNNYTPGYISGKKPKKIPYITNFTDKQINKWKWLITWVRCGQTSKTDQESEKKPNRIRNGRREVTTSQKKKKKSTTKIMLESTKIKP